MAAWLPTGPGHVPQGAQGAFLKDVHLFGRKVLAVTFDQTTDLIGSLRHGHGFMCGCAATGVVLVIVEYCESTLVCPRFTGYCNRWEQLPETWVWAGHQKILLGCHPNNHQKCIEMSMFRQRSFLGLLGVVGSWTTFHPRESAILLLKTTYILLVLWLSSWLILGLELVG